jgi:hydroxymethylbilane synthase
VDTRLKKLDAGQYDGIVLALAGLNRLSIHRNDIRVLSIETCIPACGQGALGIQCAIDNQRVIDALQKIHHLETELCVNEERTFLRLLGGGCHLAAAAHVWCDSGELQGIAMFQDPDTKQIRRANLSGDNLGQRLFNEISNGR